MSIYGPRFRLPEIHLPKMPKLLLPKPKTGLKWIGAILILMLVIATLLFVFSIPLNFNQHISVSWQNNPLDLSNSTSNAELALLIKNNTENTETISLNVNTQSKELIIFCPDAEFPNVAPNHSRKTTCIIRRNPNEKIFAGTYKINIITNLGESSTTLEIIK